MVNRPLDVSTRARADQQFAQVRKIFDVEVRTAQLQLAGGCDPTDLVLNKAVAYAEELQEILASGLAALAVVVKAQELNADQEIATLGQNSVDPRAAR